MKTDKYNIELKVGDYVLLDSYTGMEYGTSAGTIVQIKQNRLLPNVCKNCN